MRTRLILFISLLTACQAGTGLTSSQSPTIVASIRPIHSITSHLTNGITEPKLLLDKPYSPHHYPLKPSDLMLLNQSDLIIWVGPSLESGLTKTLSSADKYSKTLTLINTENLKLLKTRRKDAHKHFVASNIGDHNADPHFWLNPLNTLKTAEQITKSLIRIDPGHSDTYKNNLKSLKKQLELLDDSLSKRLLNSGSRPFLVAHDAFQYLEQQYQLKSIGALSAHPDHPPSAKHMLHIRKQIHDKSVNCLFHGQLYPEKQIRAITHQNSIKSIELDYMGYKLSTGKNLYIDMMNKLAETINLCMQ